MIGLLLGHESHYARQVHDGVIDFALKQRKERWRTLVAIPERLFAAKRTPELPWMGIVAGIRDTATAERLTQIGCPVVNVSARALPLPLPFACILFDNVRAGEAAASYFLDLGYQHFGFVAESNNILNAERGEGFCARVRAAGGSVSWFGPTPDRSMQGSHPYAGQLTDWLVGLPKPAAIYAVFDAVAANVHAAAVAAKISVPAELSILGTDDEPNTHFGMLGISSVAMPHRRLGREAAALLDRLIEGQTPDSLITRLQPDPIVTRATSAARAVEDRAMLDAFKLIQDRSCDGIDVSDVVKAVPMSRRTLERRYRQAFGQTPRLAIQQVRITRACSLLTDTKLTMAEIASACGYNDRVRLAIEFRKTMNQTPSAYRQAHQRRYAGHG